MRCVVYDPTDMEALTVIDVPQHFIRELESGKRGRVLRFSILEPQRFSVSSSNDLETELMKIAEVKMEQFVYGEVSTWYAIALNPEICLLMRSEFLPGQRREVNRREREGFVAGLMTAFGMEG